MAPPHVLMIGAGMGGLTLAQALRKQNIPFQIFERDDGPLARGPGYALGLYDLEALFDNSLPDDLPPFSSTCHLLPLDLPSQVIFYFPTGNMAMVEDTPVTPCIRANRFKLRSLLSTGVDIQWGKKAIRFEETPDNVTVHFEDGTTATGDIVVGADGTFSSVRPHFLAQPNDSILQQFPVTVTAGETTLSSPEMQIQLQNGHSCFIAIQPTFVLFSGLNSVKVNGNETSGQYYWVLTEYDLAVSDLNHWSKTVSQAERLARAKQKVQALKPELRVTVERTEVADVKSNAWSAWWDAFIEHPPAVNRVVLIGDAAHPITPIRGEGAIFAIRDAVQLSKVLAGADNNDFPALQASLDSFQKDVLAKGLESIRESRDAYAGKFQRKQHMAWGHDLRPIDAVKPLPVKLMNDA
ncbi:FAD-dependent urate hydroxylase [Podospora australis]|uniref:FAD-dependent urate hydroxylase n=1 Tax=Podospora australis TaxID=1536484 RepID=A0AAN7AFD1_9PEZI|nr:FAD-dependent urate hydroxylase [Podospora australis]